jgi:hypothetical protein
MKRTTFLLLMTIFMIICTTTMIYAAFYVMPPNRTNFVFITFTSLLSIMGYLGAMLYFDSYLIEKGGKGL